MSCVLWLQTWKKRWSVLSPMDDTLMCWCCSQEHGTHIFSPWLLISSSFLDVVCQAKMNNGKQEISWCLTILVRFPITVALSSCYLVAREYLSMYIVWSVNKWCGYWIIALTTCTLELLILVFLCSGSCVSAIQLPAYGVLCHVRLKWNYPYPKLPRLYSEFDQLMTCMSSAVVQ